MPQMGTIEGYLISPQQKRLWNLGQQNKGYGSHCLVRLEGQVDGSTLYRALTRVTRRHEALRTRYITIAGMRDPIQVVDQEDAWAYREIDLRAMGAASAACWRQALGQGQTSRAQASEGGWQTLVGWIGERKQELWLSLAGMSGDWQSIEHALSDMAQDYGRWIDGEKGATEEALAYVQYCEWVKGLLEEEEGKGHLYWREQDWQALRSGKRPLAPGAGDKIGEFKPQAVRAVLDESVVRQVLKQSRKLDKTVASFWLASWQALLWHLTGEGEQVVGYVCDGRKYEEMEGAIGLYSKWAPVRSQVQGTDRFSELLEQAQEEIRQANAWQEYFVWEEAVGMEAGQESDYFPVGIEIARRKRRWRAGETEWKLAGTESLTERYDVLLRCLWEEEGGLEVELSYSQAVYEEATARRLLGYWLELVRNVARTPEALIGCLEVLSASEREQILLGWNQTSVDYAENGFVHEWIECRANQHPERIAVRMNGNELTYGAMNEQAVRVAQRLGDLGIRPEVRVGVLLTRSPELVIAMLGIWKSGAAYVPLDPKEASERLQYIIGDAGLSVMISSERLEKRVTGLVPQVVRIEQASQGLSGMRMKSELKGDNLAYVIYTSGSTGQPKGVMVTQAGLGNYLRWCLEGYKAAEEWETPVHSPVSFDLTVTALWAPLVAGGQLELIPETLGGDGLLQALERKETWGLMKLTPAHLDLLRCQGVQDSAGGSRVVVLGGEALYGESTQWWMDRFPQSRLFNEYGPTETVVGCCVYEVSADCGNGPVPIGRPIANTRIYILDARQQPAPVGVAGEIYIGGAGVARGYLNRPELTAERFLPDPFSAMPSDRLYRTGDLGLYRVDGVIEYLGRQDEQVKVNGYRIELGEVEAALKKQNGVHEAAVSVQKNEGREGRLVGYVVLQQQVQVQAEELRRGLEQCLPHYMIPAIFVFLPNLPLTRNGKVDRLALPPPTEARLESAAPLAVPRTMTEEVLATIWSDVLKLKQIGIHDNFFALGGDSIRSIQVRARAEQQGLQISSEQLFQFQTIAELATQVSFEPKSEIAAELSEPFSLISQLDREKLSADVEDAYPLASLQAGMIFHSELSPDSAIYHDLHSFHLRVPLDLEKLRVSVQQAIDRHPLLRTSFELSRYSQPLQLVWKYLRAKIVVEDLSHLSPEEQEEAILQWMGEDKARRFEWNIAPLVRFQVHRRSEQTFQFSLSFHHTVLDGWSVASLLTELFHRYLSLLGGRDLELEPPLATSFREFVSLEQAALNSDECRRYWEELLLDAKPSRLPRWRMGAHSEPQPAIAVVPVPIPIEVSEGLKRLARSASVPIKSVLLAAHLRVMSLQTGEHDVLTGLVSNGRPEIADGDRVLGLFLNTVPFRLKLTGRSWTDLVSETFEAERRLLPFRRHPLAELQKGKGRLYETAFNFMHYHVYQSLSRSEDIQILSYTGYEETNFPFTANASLDPISSRLHLHLNYHTAEFYAEQIQRICEHYANALREMVSRSSDWCPSARLLSTEEFELLRDWSRGQVERVKARSVHQLFEQVAGRRPHQTAVEYGTQCWSYGQLIRYANRLASILTEMGVGPESRVGILLRRTPYLVAAILGVWKAGAAFVPLEPTHPAERLRYMVEDAQIQVLLTEDNFRGLTEPWTVPTVKLDEESEIAPWVGMNLCVPEFADGHFHRSGSSQHASTQGFSEENAAYIIYTSGSTGRPKGVLVTHRGLTNYVTWSAQAYGASAGRGTLVHTSVGFDLTLTSLVTPLAVGQRIVLLEQEPGIEILRAGLEKETGLSYLKLTPAHLRGLGEVLDAERARRTHALVVGGEALGWAEVVPWRSAAPGTRIINEYGPTETVVGCCVYEVEKELDTATVPIGRPIANTEIYVLDEELEPVPVGVVGELYIGGAGLLEKAGIDGGAVRAEPLRRGG
jgi:amino acid adenylation domain-containing protein